MFVCVPSLFTASICILVGLLSWGCNTPTKPDPIADDPPRTVQRQSFTGCYAANASFSSIGCGVVNTFGSAFADSRFAAEVQLQSTFWQGVPATVVAFNECTPQEKNAYAGPDRVIRFGYFMHNELIAQYPDGLPVAGVLAHEWGHQIQFLFQWINANQRTAKPTELEADAFAGFYMGLAKGWAWGYINSYFNSVFSFGDYHFNSPNHHGTPNERLAAARLGFETAYSVSTTGRPLSYLELHALFRSILPSASLAGQNVRDLPRDLIGVLSSPQIEEVRRVATGHGSGSDVTVPGSAAYRRQLFPRP